MRAVRLIDTLSFLLTLSERIDISVDPFTGRNPSYCFVELTTKEQADRAMVELDGKDFQGRPVRVKPGVAKSAQDRSTLRSPNNSPGRFSNDKTGSPSGDRWQRSDAPSSPYNKGNGNENSRRLYVGGLPKITDQETIDSEVQAFFKGYNVYVYPEVSPVHRSTMMILIAALFFFFFFRHTVRPLQSLFLPIRRSASSPATIIIYLSTSQPPTKQQQHKLRSMAEKDPGEAKYDLEELAASRGSPRRDKNGLHHGIKISLSPWQKSPRHERMT